MIYVKINDNGTINAFETTVSDSIKYETIKFEFPQEWQGYSKTAIFRNKDIILNVVLDSANDFCISEEECYIPYEVLKAPSFTVSVFGVLGDSRVTSSKAEIKVIESGYAVGDTPSIPTPTEYEQLLNLANATSIIAQSVRDDADNGLFKGDKGDTGPQGIQGPQGVQGEKGENGKDAVIDQTYNPTSENAQSGKAMAEAIKNKVDKTIGKGLSTCDYTITDKARVAAFQYTTTGGIEVVSSAKGTANNSVATKGYVDEAVNNIEVDQTYNPTSENAQSGKAVAEAVANKQGKLNNYELIMKIIVGYSILSTKPDDWDTNFTAYYKNTGTSKEPTYTVLTEFEEWENGKYFEYIAQDSKLNLVSDNDGNLFELKGVIIAANFKAANTTRSLKFDFRCNTYSSATVYKLLEVNIANGLQTTDGWYEACFEAINGGVWKGHQNLNYTITPYISRYIPSEEPCRRIRFDCEIPAGSTITIYGVRV